MDPVTLAAAKSLPAVRAAGHRLTFLALDNDDGVPAVVKGPSAGAGLANFDVTYNAANIYETLFEQDASSDSGSIEFHWGWGGTTVPVYFGFGTDASNYKEIKIDRVSIEVTEVVAGVSTVVKTVNAELGAASSYKRSMWARFHPGFGTRDDMIECPLIMADAKVLTSNDGSDPWGMDNATFFGIGYSSVDLRKVVIYK